MARNKAQVAGHSHSVAKTWNTVAGHLWGSDIDNQYLTVH